MKAALIALALLALPVGGCATGNTQTALLDAGKALAAADLAVIGAADLAAKAAPALPVAARQEVESDLDNANALLEKAHVAYAAGDALATNADLANVNAGLAALKTLIGGH